MDITPLVPANRQLIHGYGDGGFTVSAIRHEGPVLVLADRTIAWDAADAGAVTLESLAAVIADRPDILVLGCGKAMVAPPRALRAALKAEGIVVEAMDTGAACRTYNVLLTEGRRAAAALIPV